MSCPSRWIDPSSTKNVPATAFSREVFPQPFGLFRLGNHAGAPLHGLLDEGHVRPFRGFLLHFARDPVGAEAVHQRAGFRACARVHDESGGLVDRDHRGVFVKDFDGQIFGGSRERRPPACRVEAWRLRRAARRAARVGRCGAARRRPCRAEPLDAVRAVPHMPARTDQRLSEPHPAWLASRWWPSRIGEETNGRRR